MKDKDVIIDISRTKLYDYGGNMHKRWEIGFYVYDANVDKLVRKKDYIPKKLNKQQRYELAEVRIAAINEALLAGNHVKVASKNKKVSVSTAFRAIFNFKSKVLNGRSAKSIEGPMNVFLAWMAKEGRAKKDIRKLERKDFYDYQVYLKTDYGENLSNRTVNNYINYLHALITDMNKYHSYFDKNPAKVDDLKVVKSLKNRGLTKAEKDIILPKLRLDEYKELYLYVCIIYYMWIRPNECYQLRVSSFDFERGKIFIKGQDSKVKKYRWVTMPKGFLKMLEKYNVTSYPPGNFIFSPTGDKNKMFGLTAYKGNSLTQKHRKLCDHLGLGPDVVPYCWKSTGVYDAVENGMLPYQVMVHGGWSNLKQVLLYLEKTGINKLEEEGASKIPEL